MCARVDVCAGDDILVRNKGARESQTSIIPNRVRTQSRYLFFLGCGAHRGPRATTKKRNKITPGTYANIRTETRVSTKSIAFLFVDPNHVNHFAVLPSLENHIVFGVARPLGRRPVLSTERLAHPAPGRPSLRRGPAGRTPSSRARFCALGPCAGSQLGRSKTIPRARRRGRRTAHRRRRGSVRGGAERG